MMEIRPFSASRRVIWFIFSFPILSKILEQEHREVKTEWARRSHSNAYFTEWVVACDLEQYAVVKATVSSVLLALGEILLAGL